MARKTGWSTLAVSALVAGTGISAYAIASEQAKTRKAGERDYSNPGKFEGPKYASLRDLELVSSLNFKFLRLGNAEGVSCSRLSKKSVKLRERIGFPRIRKI